MSKISVKLEANPGGTYSYHDSRIGAVKLHPRGDMLIGAGITPEGKPCRVDMHRPKPGEAKLRGNVRIGTLQPPGREAKRAKPKPRAMSAFITSEGGGHLATQIHAEVMIAGRFYEVPMTSSEGPNGCKQWFGFSTSCDNAIEAEEGETVTIEAEPPAELWYEITLP